MSHDQQRLIDYLNHIVQAIERIQRYTDDLNEVSFLENELVQDAVIRNLEIVGEASNNIQKKYPDFENSHPTLPLSYAYEMRNAIAHGYFKVDLEIVWNTIQNDLFSFQVQIKDVVQELIKNTQ